MTRRSWPGRVAALAGLASTLVCGWPAPAQAAGDAAAGKLLFAKCASCHQLGPSARGGFGPQLNGVIGRRAAATGDFRYSEALKRSGIVWSEATLAAFIRAPKELVPGTSMRFLGIGDARQVDDLLAYLRSAS